MKGIRLATILGVPVTARRPALLSSIVLWAIFAGVGLVLLDLPPGAAVVGGFLAMALHWLGDLWHQIGHLLAGRSVGYPMAGLRLHWFLIASYYSRDEPELPAAVHVRRALGGMPASFLLAALTAPFLAMTAGADGLGPWLIRLLFWENLLVFGLGALAPLGFTDGSTLLTWVPRLRQPGQEG